MFYVAPTGIVQLYPNTGAQSLSVSGAGVYPLGDPTSVVATGDGRLSPQPEQSYRGYSRCVSAPATDPFGVVAAARANRAAQHTVLVIASTVPLRVGSPMFTAKQVNAELRQRGSDSAIDSDQGLTAVVQLVVPMDRSAETVVVRSKSPIFAAPELPASGPTRTVLMDGHSLANDPQLLAASRCQIS
jgi:hypothetical protein